MDLFSLGKTKKIQVIDDNKKSHKSCCITLDLGTLVACGATPQEAVDQLKTQLAISLEAILQLDFEQYEIKTRMEPAWIPEKVVIDIDSDRL